MIKRFLLIVIIFDFTNSILFAQVNYYITDSLASYGVNLIDGGAYNNSKQCEIKEGEKSIIYGPDKVEEFGFSDGRVYVRKAIYINSFEKTVFLNRLVKGKITLYYYKGDEGRIFFLEKDSLSLVKILKKDTINKDLNFHDILNKYLNDCENSSEPIKLVTYNALSLKNLIERYNSCELKPFPFFKYGLVVGFEETSILQNSNISNDLLKKANFNIDYSFTFGVFIDAPLFQSDFSFHPEIYYQKNGFSSHVNSNQTIYDYVINTKSFVIPLLLRYTYPSMNYSFFGNLGILYSNNFYNSNLVYRTTVIRNLYEISEAKDELINSSHKLGYSMGVGIQHKIGIKNCIFSELRYNHLYGLTNGTLANSQIQFLIGLSL